MMRYFWNPETDEVTPAKYDILRDPPALCGPEFRALEKNRLLNLSVGVSDIAGLWISTVFLGFDHDFYGGGDPVLFETMIFDRHTGRTLSYQDRYTSGREARAAHAKIDRLGRWLLLKAPQVSKRKFAEVLGNLSITRH